MRHEILDAMEDREIILVEHKRELISSLITKKILLKSRLEELLKTYGVGVSEVSEYKDLQYQYEKITGLISYIHGLSPF